MLMDQKPILGKHLRPTAWKIRFAAHPLPLKNHFLGSFSFGSFEALSFPFPAFSFFFFGFLLARKAFAAACHEDRHVQERFKGVDAWNEKRAMKTNMKVS